MNRIVTLEELAEAAQRVLRKIQKSEDIPPEIADLINRHFWELAQNKEVSKTRDF